MAGLFPFQPLPGAPGLGLSLPKAAPDAGHRQEFGAMYDQLQQLPDLTPPAQHLTELPVPPSGAPEAISGMAKPLHEFLDSVNTLQLQADDMKEELASGGDVELHQVMIAEEKAGLAVDLTMQLRNKLVDAYQEIMRMSV